MTNFSIANAPCSWGTLEFAGLSGERITYTQMLDELVATGYTGTELGDWGFMPTDPSQLAAELQHRQLTLIGAFVPVALQGDTTQIATRTRHEQLDYFAAIQAGIFCELGRGAVDFAAIARTLTAINYQGWIVVEQDVLPGMGEPRISAAHNRDYLRSIGL